MGQGQGAVTIRVIGWQYVQILYCTFIRAGLLSSTELFPGEPFADGSAAAYGGDAVAAAESLLACCDVEEDRYAVGRTRLFLRQGVLGELERRRLEYIGARAATVQATARGMIGRRSSGTMRQTQSGTLRG